MSRHRYDIARAVSALVSSLTFADAYARKNAIGALLHYAKKTPGNVKSVKRASKATALDKRQRDIKRFLSELGQLK